MVFGIINRNWGDIILKVHCFHCCNIKATPISSIKVHVWLTSPEDSNLPEIKLFIPEWIFNIKSSECSVCIHCKSNPTNWSIVEKLFSNEMVLSGRNDESLFKNFQLLNSWTPQESSRHVPSFLVIIILESNTTSVNWTINNSKDNVGVVANHAEVTSGSD